MMDLQDKKEKSEEIYNYGLNLLNYLKENNSELENLDELSLKLETSYNRILNYFQAFESENPKPSMVSDLIREAVKNNNQQETEAWTNTLNTHIEAFEQFNNDEIVVLYHKLHPIEI